MKTPRDLVCAIIEPLNATVFGKRVHFRVYHDMVQSPMGRENKGRLFIQCFYEDKCRVTGEIKEWSGRKWYLSDYMTEDEVVKTCYAAFKATVEHEIMEGFTYSGHPVFNSFF